MNPPVERPTSVRVCGQCGAENPTTAAACWLCQAELTASDEVVVAALIAPPAPAWSLGEMFFAALSALTALLVVLIGVGIFVEEFVAGVIYSILVLPPLTVTAVRQVQKTQRGDHMTWTERFLTFLVSSVVMAGLLGMLAVAAVICLIIVCIFNPPNFH